MTGPEVVACARGWIGTPYCHQASLRGVGTDCLGLVRGLWREFCGPEPLPVPAYGRDWAECGSLPALEEALEQVLRRKGRCEEAPGDVLLFRLRPGGVGRHLGIQTRCGALAGFVHAYSGHGVVESALSTPWRRRLVARFAFPQL